MNKKGLLLLPLLGGMVLAGCDLSQMKLMDIVDPLNLIHDKEEKEDKEKEDEKKDDEHQEEHHEDEHHEEEHHEDEEHSDDTIPSTDKLGPEEFQGYKRVAKPVEGHTYILGYYNYSAKTMKFANGHYHTDQNGEYPYYMATTENTVEGAAKFSVTYVNETEFNIKVSAPGTEWDNKYMACYLAESSHGNPVVSIAPVDQLTDKYVTTKNETVDVNGNFICVDKIGETDVQSFGIMMTHEGNGETEPTLRMFGCAYDSYVSIDCSIVDKAIGADYAIAHFFEKA